MSTKKQRLNFESAKVRRFDHSRDLSCTTVFYAQMPRVMCAYVRNCLSNDLKDGLHVKQRVSEFNVPSKEIFLILGLENKQKS